MHLRKDHSMTLQLRRAPLYLGLLLSLCAVNGCKHRAHHDTDLADNVQKVVASPQLAIMKWSNYSDYQPLVAQFYAARQYALAWSDSGAITPQAVAMMEQFSNAAQKGLKPEDYDAARWADRAARVKHIHDSNDTSQNAQDNVAQFDAALTISAMRYLSDLHSGRVNPQQLNFDVDVPAKRAAFNLPQVLEQQVLSAADVPGVVASVEPQSPLYAATERALPEYLELAQQQSTQGFSPLPAVAKSVSVNGTYADMAGLIQRLQLEGYLTPPPPAQTAAQTTAPQGQHAAPSHHRRAQPIRNELRKLHVLKSAPVYAGSAYGGSSSADTYGGTSAPPPVAEAQPIAQVSPLYTQEVSDAVKVYQSRNGLTADGKLSTATIAAMNVPMALRVQQIDDALERWRWLPEEFQQPRVLVNLAEFLVRTYNADHTEAFSMKVVDGKNDGHDTPFFVRHMRYLIFRPYWNLPADIVKKEVSRHDKAWMDKNDYEATTRDGKPVTDFSMEDLAHARFAVRQKPGPKNALGLVKFMFPNEYDIYMHSTPEMNLFNLTMRDKSHGCVRLNDAEKMADWVLQDDPRWDGDKIHAAMYGGPADGSDAGGSGAPAIKDNHQVNLQAPLPVVLGYFTAMPNEDGTLHFFDDVYGYDKAMNAILAKGMPYPSAAGKVNPKVTPGETE
jgi:murein L,D-transpeptidase YcbB/YkuD